ncbi:MAG: PadR family transcriptional regulator [Gemmatimonadales bacterium]
MSTLDYHVLLAMAGGPIHGYAVKQAVEAESAGTLMPRAGSLYRVIARLMARGFVKETRARSAQPHPGLARRYYALTPAGRSALAQEAHRLKDVAALAERRLETV